MHAFLSPLAPVNLHAFQDRMGQTKPTTVHKYIIGGTIETAVHELSEARRSALTGSGGSMKAFEKEEWDHEALRRIFNLH